MVWYNIRKNGKVFVMTHSQLKHIVIMLAAVSSFSLFAGNWTLSGGVLTSSDGQWSFSGASKSGTTLTVGACTSAATDGILDFRNTTVNGESVTTIAIANKTTWGSANIKEFYCDTLSKVADSLFSGSTTLEKIQVATLSNKSIGSSAFKSCSSLTTANFGGLITGVSSESFNGCQNLDVAAEDLISPNISSFALRAFNNCKKLHGKLVLNNVNSFSSSGSCLNSIGIEELVIQSENPSFTTFSTAAFASCTSLTNVTIKSTKFTALGSSNVFGGCTALKRVTLDLPNLNSVGTGTQNTTKLLYGCNALKEVYIVGEPWKDANGNDLMDYALTKHLLISVPAVAANTDAPKKCTVYAIRHLFRDFASAMSGKEPNHAPPKCYGVYVDQSSSRKAYMVQSPYYKSGMFVSVQ